MNYPSQSVKISKPLKIMGARFVPSLILSLCAFGFSLPAMGEGSRTLYPSTADPNQYRSQIEWTNRTLLGPPGANVHIQRRTLLRVYANPGEYILLGSSAINVPNIANNAPNFVSRNGGNGDIVLYEPSEVTFNTVGDEELPGIVPDEGGTAIGTPLFTCNGNGRVNAAGTGNFGDRMGDSNRGIIATRAQELAGPQAADGTNVSSDQYPPCYYQVPPTSPGGIYYVAFFGTHGPNVTNANPFGAETIGELARTRDMSNGHNDDGAQQTSVAAWDITVRRNDPSTTDDINGRVWTYYMSTSTGLAQNRPTSFQIYMVTNDGYIYTTEMDQISPNGFTIYGNQRGFLNGDGTTLFRDVVASTGLSVRESNNLFDLMGDVQVTYPQFPLFFNQPDILALGALQRVGLNGEVSGSGTPDPIAPVVNSVSFAGNARGTGNAEDALVDTNNAGTLTIETNITVGNFEVIISGNAITDRAMPPGFTDPAFDPTSPTNRTYTGILNAGATNPAGITVSGRTITINWDGRDNAGNFFTAGENYPIHVRVRGGEYHFPMIDVEHNAGRGPILRLTQLPPGTTDYPEGFRHGVNTGFYDDRVYEDSNENTINTGGVVGNTLCHGVGDVPDPNRSDPLIGYDTTTNQRDFGDISLPDSQSTGNNTNTVESCQGTFGDKKGLDLWTFFPSERRVGFLNVIVPTAHLLLAKRITGVNTDVRAGFNDVDTNNDGNDGNDDDNNANWPTPNTSSLAGTLQEVDLEPGDEVEFTIYFLSDGNAAAENVSLCDAVPENMTFLETAFNGQTPQDLEGIEGANLGIALALNDEDDAGNPVPTEPTDYLTNLDDGDRGQFIAPGEDPPASCLKDDGAGSLVPMTASDNTNGLIVVDIFVRPSGTSTNKNPIPNATGSGVPSNSYGFIRFRAVVD